MSFPGEHYVTQGGRECTRHRGLSVSTTIHAVGGFGTAAARAMVETVTGSLWVTDPAHVGDYLSLFDSLTERAIQGTDAYALIRNATPPKSNHHPDPDTGFVPASGRHWTPRRFEAPPAPLFLTRPFSS
ncbi:Scr1 family TA system antitoxin-like transcriptional regulator [Nocardia africana]|uniref:Scr1 family TA system antitoxin-like transcriptional regulator n=1 Tax=Nocardia africana TaxID=134964 RepID=A0ABW6NW62_9NOCA